MADKEVQAPSGAGEITEEIYSIIVDNVSSDSDGLVYGRRRTAIAIVQFLSERGVTVK